MSITDADRLKNLEDAVTRIEGILNVPRFMSTRLGVEDWKKAKNAAPLLPSGDRNVYDRMREIGISQDDIVAAFADVVAQLGDSRKEIASLRAEIAELKASQSTQIPATPEGTPFPVGAQVIEGDVVFKGRVGFGGLNPEANAQIHILGQNDATILFGSNLSGGQWQSPKAHWAQKSLSGDGGFRDLQNGYTTIESRDAYDPDGKVWYKSQLKTPIDSTRPSVNIGPDSRGDWSLSKKMPPGAKDENGNEIPEHEYTQDVVLKIYEGEKKIALESYRRGWTWAFGVDCKYGPARWWKAVFG